MDSSCKLVPIAALARLASSVALGNSVNSSFVGN